MKPDDAMQARIHPGLLIAFAFLFSLLTGMSAWSDVRDQAKRIHDRIAGVPPDETTLSSMATLLGTGNQQDALPGSTT
jgi:hypothetical protein